MPGLMRSGRDAVVFGVCGGIAEAFQVNSSVVRLAFAVLALAWGVGGVLYLLLALLMAGPGQRGSRSFLEQLQNNVENLVSSLPARRRGIGIVFVTLGAVILLAQFGLFEWLTWARVFPLLLVLVGVLLFLQDRSRR